MDRIIKMLGFARRAGKIGFGVDGICKAMAKKNAAPKLIVISKAASDSTKGKLVSKSEFYGIRYIEIDMASQELGRLLGKEYAPAAVAVNDSAFAEEILKAYSALQEQ